ncbi:hypothetical protein [Falsirhodobacter deserti]|uniref:hypothetical protein n=1 Tax=Falsirhodobacter deserti TaxID=1365611 RepID=UPI000FE2E51E|nr:hypothetical protein [Falsirhodobacter deserti]
MKGNPDDAEIAASDALGLKHDDFGLSASKGLDQAKAEQLIALLRDAPKPVLIHCKSGSDRPGQTHGTTAALRANL